MPTGVILSPAEQRANRAIDIAKNASRPLRKQICTAIQSKGRRLEAHLSVPELHCRGFRMARHSERDLIVGPGGAARRTDAIQRARPLATKQAIPVHQETTEQSWRDPPRGRSACLLALTARSSYIEFSEKTSSRTLHHRSSASSGPSRTPPGPVASRRPARAVPKTGIPFQCASSTERGRLDSRKSV